MTQTNSQAIRRCSLGQSSNVQRTESSSVEPSAPIATATEVFNHQNILDFAREVSRCITRCDAVASANPWTATGDNARRHANQWRSIQTICYAYFYCYNNATYYHFNDEKRAKWEAEAERHARHLTNIYRQIEKQMEAQATPTPETTVTPTVEAHHAAPKTAPKVKGSISVTPRSAKRYAPMTVAMQAFRGAWRRHKIAPETETPEMRAARADCMSRYIARRVESTKECKEHEIWKLCEAIEKGEIIQGWQFSDTATFPAHTTASNAAQAAA